MIFTGDVLSLLNLLNEHRVEYMIIGGTAVNIHGFSRATGDMDIWFNPTPENFSRLLQSVELFGFEVPDEFRNLDYIRNRGLIRLPLEKFYIEFLADVGENFQFDKLYPRCETTVIDENLELKVIGYTDLISLKLSVHRAKDLEDVKNLERVRNRAGKKMNLFQKVLKKFFGG